MKTSLWIGLWVGILLGASAAPAAETASRTVARVGVYDSRVVAYAYFWSAPVRRERDALIARAKAAKQAGDTTRLEELQSQIVAGQKRMCLEVFSRAPAVEALAAIKDKLPAIQAELGVARCVSKWDESALKHIPAADRVDVTDRLVAEFLPTPTDRQRKTMDSCKAGEPLPLWQAKLLNLFGGM